MFSFEEMKKLTWHVFGFYGEVDHSHLYSGTQIYEFVQGQFLYHDLDRQENRIKLVSTCLAFFGGSSSLVKGREYVGKRFIHLPTFRALEGIEVDGFSEVRKGITKSSKKCHGLSA